jgi:hypothetical protein
MDDCQIQLNLRMDDHHFGYNTKWTIPQIQLNLPMDDRQIRLNLPMDDPHFGYITKWMIAKFG